MAVASWTVEEVRSGTIRLWSGLLSNIPSGYVLCDGANGSPDLRDKFVKGAPAGQNPGQTGGQATHSHADHPAMTHAGSAVGNHTNVPVPATATGAVKVGTSASNAAAQTHTHTIATITHSVTQPDQHSAQGHDSPNSEPPYYTVAYIMKT